MPIAAVIPARYASTRFPGKPLALIHGKPMVVHVCERAAEAGRINHFWVATDDERIASVVREAGYEARMTPVECANGTDRIAASLRGEDPYEILVNVQGDEPRIAPEVIDAVAGALVDNPQCGVSTAAVPILKRDDFESPHIVKVVLSVSGEALYFSRTPIPSLARVTAATQNEVGYGFGLKHMGIYGYRTEVVKQYAQWRPTPLEMRECLEQLRMLERGIRIQVAVVEEDSIGVDTPEELALLNATEKVAG